MSESFTKIDIKTLTQNQLSAWLDRKDVASYRTRQIFKWVYLRQADDFAQMSDLSKPFRDLLARHFTIPRLKTLHIQTSADHTRKYLFGLTDGHRIESVLIPERNHATLCVSTQVGCAQGCRFCKTAQGGFMRNLTAGEIVDQVRDILHAQDGSVPLTNIVFMGMGEPLANYRQLVLALDVLTDNECGLRFSNRRVTVSTAGLVSRLVDLGRDTKVNLAISLNATDDETRNRLMPINRNFPLKELLGACRRYPLQPHRRITFEYILIKGVNDSLEDALRLCDLLKGIRSKINLIPFNAYADCPLERSADATILQFQQLLIQNHYTAMIRKSKGEDISAACGQLSGRWQGAQD